MNKAPAAPVSTIVIFGVTGDLTRRLLMPALVNLRCAKLLHAKASVLGVSHGGGDDETLRHQLEEFVDDGPEWRQLRQRLAYSDLFDLGHRTGYETLLYDVLIGDQTLFQRADQIEGGWRAIQPLLDAWHKGEPEEYTAGTAGPSGADELIERDGRSWHAIG